MEELRIEAGMIVRMKDGSRWRLLHVNGMSCRIFKMDTTKRAVKDISANSLANLVSDGSAVLERDNPVCLDVTSLSAKSREEYEHRLSFIKEFAELYGPDYTLYFKTGKKRAYVDLYTRYGFSQPTADKTIRIWFQSGCQNEVLAYKKKANRPQHYEYKKKTGRPTAIPQGVVFDKNLEEAFQFGLNEFKSGRNVTIREAYVRLIHKFYMEEKDGCITLVPADRRPTEKQFRNYLLRMLSREDIEEIKTSAREYRNNSRLLLSGPLDPTLSPGRSLEADALEVDINIVSSFDCEQNISRPILYILVDRYSHAIVAFHVGLDNNSMMGLSSLMMNLFDDKKVLLKNRNIDIDPSCWWPEPFIPHEIRCDRGSDFASDQFSEICRQLNIERTLEPGAMGSMKGLVEESFRLFHQGVSADFEGYGVIAKRHDSNHKREACLTIDDMYFLAVEFVRFHNTYYSKNRRLSRDMMKKGIDKTPMAIWNYGLESSGAPMPVTHLNRSKLLYSLMKEERASISRNGICLHGLYYSAFDSAIVLKMKVAEGNAGKRDREGNKINSMLVRVDPRSINSLYYIVDNELKMLNIIPSKCGGLRDMTWEEYSDYRRAERERDRKGDEANLINKVLRKGFNDSILSRASSSTYANTGDILPARKKEKNKEHFNNRIEQRLKGENRVLSSSTPLREKEDSMPVSNKALSEQKESENSSVFDNDLARLMFGDNY